MASLEGLPPLPKSLSGLNLHDYNVFQPSTSPYSNHSASGGENNFSRSYSLSPKNGNLVTGTGRSYGISTGYSSENIILGRTRTTPPLKDVAPSLGYKQLFETPPMMSARASHVINSSINTPHSSSRGSPVVPRGSTSPVPAFRGATPPIPRLRSLAPPTPPPRQSQLNLLNGLELSPSKNQPGSSAGQAG